MSGRTLRIQHIPRFQMESGDVLRDAVQAYYLDGELNAERDNVVLVFHALTGSADAAGDWWQEAIGPGRAIDTTRYAVLCTNLLGSCYGSSGPAEAGRDGFPPVTTRDQARFIQLLVEELQIPSVALATGGSLGGMVAMEWAASFPDLARAVVVLAAPAAHTAQAIGWNHVQRRAIAAAGEQGLEIARMAAMLTYRTADEMAERFGRAREEDGSFAVQSYLDYQGVKLRERFDLRSYLALMDAMDSHDIGRGRGGTAAALRNVAGRLIGVGIPGDLLYTDADVREWVEAAGAEYRRIHSIRGHDAFLLEGEQVSRILAEALDSASTRGVVAAQRAGEPAGYTRHASAGRPTLHTTDNDCR